MNFNLYYAGDARNDAATYRDDLQLAILGKRKMDADDAWQAHVKEWRLCSSC